MFFRLPSFKEAGRRILSATRQQLGIRKKKTKNDNVSLNLQIRNLDNNYRWRKEILRRDNYQCVLCGSKKKLEVDHIKPLSFLIKKNKIVTVEQAMLCKEFWNTDNGRVLCRQCHKQTDTYAGKSRRYLKEHLE